MFVLFFFFSFGTADCCSDLTVFTIGPTLEAVFLVESVDYWSTQFK